MIHCIVLGFICLAIAAILKDDKQVREDIIFDRNMSEMRARFISSIEQTSSMFTELGVVALSVKSAIGRFETNLRKAGEAKCRK